jgi:ABC-2 type transport system permease protein
VDPRGRAAPAGHPAIESIRGLLLGTPVGNSPWLAAAWCLGILVASVALSGVLFRRRTA